MDKHIRCARCRFVRPDHKASDSEWTAYECGNRESEYYRALLNVAVNGGKLPRITWKGCACGKIKERGGEQ